MRMYDIIKSKRDGNELSDKEIEFFIKGYTNGSIPDYQASALCMAIYYNGMSERETVTLTREMSLSGDSADLSCLGSLSVDKHSTGGVGDKTTLIVAPIVASLGAKLAKMSGRGLGHTGGTVDKLESIDGYKTELSPKEFLEITQRVGAAVIGQSGNFCPADKKLYALRDVTATVDSIPLITSSIMSKKLASGSKNIVLDVKVGSGAFMKSLEDAKILAQEMVKIGKACQRNVTAVLSNMDLPLGNAIGNSLEVIEAAEILKGNKKGDLYEVSTTLASEMIALALDISPEQALSMVKESVQSKRAFEKMCEWVSAQGGNEDMLKDTSLFKSAEFSYDVISQEEGYISRVNAEDIGRCALMLGAGRENKEDKIDFSAGIILNKKPGDFVKKGEALCKLFTNKKEKLSEAEELFISACEFSHNPIENQTMIYEIIR